MTIRDEISELEGKLARLRQIERSAPCAEVGHRWRHIGGKNAGCELDRDCKCSVPVHECEVCGDCDYGDNAEAREKRSDCAYWRTGLETVEVTSGLTEGADRDGMEGDHAA